MAPVETYQAIASFKFIGEEEVRRMANAMQQAGLVSEQGVARMVNAAAQLGQGLITATQAQTQFVNALGLSVGATSQLAAQMEALSRGSAPPQGLRDTVNLVSQLEQAVGRLNQAGSRVPVGIGEKIRAEFGALFTQAAGMMAAAPVKTGIRLGAGNDASQIQLETALGNFIRTNARLTGGQGYGLNFPGPDAMRRAQTGDFDRTFANKAQLNAAVREVLASFGTQAQRGTLPGQRTVTGPAPEAPSQVRVNTRLERMLEAQAQQPAAPRVDPLAVAPAIFRSSGPADTGQTAFAAAYERAMQRRAAEERQATAIANEQARRNAAAMAAVAAAAEATRRTGPGVPGRAALARAAQDDARRAADYRANDFAGQFGGAQANLSEQFRLSQLGNLGTQVDALAAKMRGLATEIGRVEADTAAARARRGPAALGMGGMPFTTGAYQQIGPRMQGPMHGPFWQGPGPFPGPRPTVYNVTSLPGGQGPFTGPSTVGPDPNWRHYRPPADVVRRDSSWYYGPPAGGAPPPGGGGGGGGAFVPFGGGGRGGGFFSDFASGFRGNPDRSIAEQLGQTARFAVYYGAAYKLLFALTQTLQVSVDEAIKFQQGLSELNIATGRSSEANRDLAQNLGDAAAAAGLSPFEGLEIGARAIGLYDLQGAGQQVQEAAMRQATTAVSRMQFTTGRKPEQLQLDVGAISQAFDFGYQAINRIADLDAYFTKRFGIKTGQTLETTAQVGSLGIQAGFSPEEIFAISGKLQSRTGQTPAAVAGLLSQIFSRAGEGSLQSMFGQYGVDTQASYRDQFAQLSQRFQGLAPEAQQRLSASFGRGRSQGAAAVLLEDFGEIAQAAEASKTEAAGAADSQFEARINNVGGQLAQLSGAFKNFGIELANTGLLDAFAAGAVALREFFQATTSVLRVWNEIPRVGRDAILAVGAFALAMRLGAGRALGGALLSRAPSRLPAGMASSYSIADRTRVIAAPGATPGSTRIAATGGGATGAARALGVRGTLGATAALFGGPVGIAAIGTFAVIAAGKGLWDNLNRQAQQATDTLLSLNAVNFENVGEARGAADAIQKSAEERRNLGRTADVLSFFGAPFQDDANRASALQERRAERIRLAAGQLEDRQREESENAARSKTPFGDLSSDSITKGFTQLEQAGVSASTRLRLFNDALLATGDAAREAMAAQFDLATFTGGIADEFAGDVAAGIPEKGFSYTGTDIVASDSTNPVYVPVERNISAGDIQRRISDAYDADEMQRLLDETAAASGVTSEALTPEQLTAMTDTLRNYIVGILGPQIAAIPEVANAINSFTRTWIEDRTKDQRNAVDPNRVYTDTEITDMLNRDMGEQQKALGEVRRGDTGGRLRVLKDTLKQRLSKRGLASSDNEQLQFAIDDAYADVAEAQIERLQSQLTLGARNAPNLQAAVGMARGMRTRMLRQAVRGRNPEALAELIETGGAAEAEIAKQEIERWYKAEVAAAKTGETVENVRQRALDTFVAANPSDNAGSEAAREAHAQAAVDAYLKGPLAALDSMRKALLGGIDAGLAAGPSQATIAAAQAGAALRPGDTLGENRVAMQKAAAELRDAVGKGPVEFAEAQRNFNQAQAAYAASQIEASQVARSNRAAFTGGALSTARADLQNAADELDKYAKGTLEYNKALGDYFAKQLAFADAAREARSQARIRNLDITDPVAEAAEQQRVAEEAVQNARKRARDPRSAGGRRVTRDEQAEINTRINEQRGAQANTEQQAFQQRFNDMQVMESLGQISHAAWIQYLQSEHDRLAKIEKKTRQQIEQQQQVDQALKAAQDAFSGQFNLGDIKLPTPYEVRRYVQATTAGQMVGATAGAGPSTYIYIDGTDYGLVESTVAKSVGAGAVTTYTTAPKKA